MIYKIVLYYLKMILRFYFFGEFDIIKMVKGLVLDFNRFSASSFRRRFKI